MAEIFGNLHPDMDGEKPGFEDIVACGMPKSSYDIDTLSEFIEYVKNIYELYKELTDPSTYIKALVEEILKWLKAHGM